MPQQQVPSLDDVSVFDDFCIPELFERRTFLEMPQSEQPAPMPPAPKEVDMKDLSMEDKPAVPHCVEPCAAEPRSGKRLSESILIID